MIETLVVAVVLQAIQFSDFQRACLEGGGATGALRVPANSNIPLHQIYNGAHARVHVSIRGGGNYTDLINSASPNPSMVIRLTEASGTVIDAAGPLFLRTVANNSTIQTIDYCVAVRSTSS